MKKVVLKLDLHGEKAKQKAMKAVSGLPGLVSIAVDMKEKKLTVIGDVDPVVIVEKLRKLYYTELVAVGPDKEEKKDGEGKKEDGKKDEGKKDGGAKKEDEKKKDPHEQQIAALVEAYRNYNPHLTRHYHVVSAEDYSTGCVIC